MKKILIVDGGPRRSMNTAAHLAWRDAHWADDLAKARAAGRRMAGKALAEAEA